MRRRRRKAPLIFLFIAVCAFYFFCEMPVNLIAFPLRPYAHFPEARSCLHQQDAIADEGVASESERNREEGARSCLAFRDVHWKELTGLTFQVGSGDVRGEVRQLMRTLEEMKCALGEGPAPKSSAAIPILTMHNKTPFWNEHNQVYQVGDWRTSFGVFSCCLWRCEVDHSVPCSSTLVAASLRSRRRTSRYVMCIHPTCASPHGASRSGGDGRQAGAAVRPHRGRRLHSGLPKAVLRRAGLRSGARQHHPKAEVAP